MGNIFGRILRLTTWGESHGPAIGGVLDGFPPGFELSLEEIYQELKRRRTAGHSFASQRKEEDELKILSGLGKEGCTLGTPIAFIIYNTDARPADYEALEGVYRPGHADFTYAKKYGLPLQTGGGRASARETVARVVAGAMARQYLQQKLAVRITSYVTAVHKVQLSALENVPSQEAVEESPVRCPDGEATQAMLAAIEAARAEGDSLGGVITTDVEGLPVGLGAPVFDRLEADLAKAMLSLPATKGFEIGEGFRAAHLKGSENNDTFEVIGGVIGPASNRAGGVLGGISTGGLLRFRTAFKPPSTIAKSQQMMTEQGEVKQIASGGRHDACVLPRAVPIVEAMTALVLMDHYLLHRAYEDDVLKS